VEDERGHEELAAAGTQGNEMLRKPSHCCWQHVPVPQLGHTCHRVGLRGRDAAGVTWGITPTRWPVARGPSPACPDGERWCRCSRFMAERSLDNEY
jgi:hypothetical protein